MKHEFVCIYNVAVSANQQINAVADCAGNTEKPEICSNDKISLIILNRGGQQFYHKGINGKMYFAVKSLYLSTEACVKVNSLYTPWFDIRSKAG